MFFYINYMIPIQQLRVGSYWQLNTKTGQVLKIVTPCEIADVAEYGIGVELTPEILEKCELGDCQDVGGELTYFKWEYDNVYLTCDFVSVSNKPIEYLHQLQNLYLSLTGTELNYTP